MFDGLIVITSALEGYFRKYLKKGAEMFLLPILVEEERFIHAESRNTGYPYIAYCGSMEGDKDGIPHLLDVFHRIADDFPELKLVLAGNTCFDGFQILQKQIAGYGITDRVIFTGKLDRDEIPGWLKGAKALVLARPANKQAEGGFPTKLGEYLASGRPVVVTKTGEIPKYLTHLKDAFLAEPGDVKDISEKLHQLLADPIQAEKIGAEGFRTALRCFGYREQSEKLAEFFLKNC